MSRAIANRLERLEAARTDLTTQLVVRRAGDPAALFTLVIPYQEPAKIDLKWPERAELLTESEDDTP
ncbi:hypothetical protein ACFLRO_00555 [Bacteroidota bacterium]